MKIQDSFHVCSMSNALDNFQAKSWKFIKVDRLLSFGPTKSQLNSPEWCKDFCFPNYAYAGVQYGNECWCGNERPDDSRRKASSFCAMSCPGNSSQVTTTNLNHDIWNAPVKCRILPSCCNLLKSNMWRWMAFQSLSDRHENKFNWEWMPNIRFQWLCLICRTRKWRQEFQIFHFKEKLWQKFECRPRMYLTVALFPVSYNSYDVNEPKKDHFMPFDKKL